MKVPVAIIGGGPGGAAAAMFLQQQSIRSVIIERETFPRYHIGESMTGEAGGVLRRLGLEQEMLRRNYPQKKGVSVFGKSKKGTWYVPVMARNENGNLENQSTWQVRRSSFDQMMLNEALSRGADLIEGQVIKPLVREDGSVCGLRIRTGEGLVQDIETEVVLDCSGQATFLANCGITGSKYLGNYDKQIAIFSQVAGAIRDNGPARDKDKDNTLIFYKDKFHWAWFIPIDEETVSVGIVIPAAYFLEKKETKKDFLLRELRELHPELARRTSDTKLVEDVHVIPNYSYQVRRFCGKGFLCLGDAHRFIDPIFSFGLFVALKEAELAAPLVKAYLEGSRRDEANPFSHFARLSEKGIDHFEDLVDLFWEQPAIFAFFVHLRHRDGVIDIFAGRIYEDNPSPAITAIRHKLDRDREGSYDLEDLFSVPIGSRFHPERAALWEPTAVVESTEDWMGPR